MVDGYNRDPARIANIEFTYADPGVDVTTEQRTVEQETVDDKIVVQTLGRRPDSLTIEGVVVDHELYDIDYLARKGVVSIRTERWSGSVIVESTDTTFKRAKTKDGDWLYDVTIEALEVSEDPMIIDGIDNDDIGRLSNQEPGELG